MSASRKIDLQTFAGNSWSGADHGFVEPWQARAFALALVLSERGMFSLRDFQGALIEKISLFEKEACVAGSDDYYTLWIEALEDLLARKNVLPENRLSLLERDVVEDAESRKIHQRMTSRDENGVLRIAPIYVDPGSNRVQG
jgi:nitrile hydratase accessory protein